MRIFERFRKRRAIRSYLTVLPPLLKKRFGKHKHYTEGQVLRTLNEAGLNQKYTDYALAMYVSHHEFESLMRENKLPCEYKEIRQEIADHFLKGDTSFNTHDVFDFAESPCDLSTYGTHLNEDIIDLDHIDSCGH